MQDFIANLLEHEAEALTARSRQKALRPFEAWLFRAGVGGKALKDRLRGSTVHHPVGAGSQPRPDAQSRLAELEATVRRVSLESGLIGSANYHH